MIMDELHGDVRKRILAKKKSEVLSHTAKTRGDECAAGDCSDSVVAEIIRQFESPKVQTSEITLRQGTYWLTRIVILRYLGFIYCKWNFSLSHSLGTVVLNRFNAMKY